MATASLTETRKVISWFQSQKLGMWPLLSRAGLIDFRGGTMQY